MRETSLQRKLHNRAGKRDVFEFAAGAGTREQGNANEDFPSTRSARVHPAATFYTQRKRRSVRSCSAGYYSGGERVPLMTFCPGGHNDETTFDACSGAATFRHP